jgi:Ca2+-binding protein (EF-Hand superfamily)
MCIEFVMAVIRKEDILSKERLEKVFKMLDKDQNGTISLHEFKDYFMRENKDFDEKEWKNLIKEADENGDGVVNS